MTCFADYYSSSSLISRGERGGEERGMGGDRFNEERRGGDFNNERRGNMDMGRRNDWNSGDFNRGYQGYGNVNVNENPQVYSVPQDYSQYPQNYYPSNGNENYYGQ